MVTSFISLWLPDYVPLSPYPAEMSNNFLPYRDIFTILQPYVPVFALPRKFATQKISFHTSSPLLLNLDRTRGFCHGAVIKHISRYLGRWSIFIFKTGKCADGLNTSHCNRHEAEICIGELRKKYDESPSGRMTFKAIRLVNEDTPLDMDYSFSKDDLFADESGAESFYIF